MLSKEWPIYAKNSIDSPRKSMLIFKEYSGTGSGIGILVGHTGRGETGNRRGTPIDCRKRRRSTRRPQARRGTRSSPWRATSPSCTASCWWTTTLSRSPYPSFWLIYLGYCRVMPLKKTTKKAAAYAGMGPLGVELRSCQWLCMSEISPKSKHESFSAANSLLSQQTFAP